MWIAAKSSLMAILFILWTYVLYQLLRSLFRRRKVRYRLHYVQEATVSKRLSLFMPSERYLYRHVDDLLQSVRAQMSVEMFFMISVLLSLGGFLTGALLFPSIKGFILLGGMSLTLPYIILRMRLVSSQLSARLEFLPAVELFYQFYVLNGQQNMRVTLKQCIEENRLLYPMQPVFEQLYRNLSTDRGIDYSLRIFSLSLGHIWAQYFINIVGVALLEGNQVGDNLKDLITDMRNAKRADQLERNRLLEIRVANFSPIVFLLIFLFINFRFNSEGSYMYYVIDPAGRSMILDAMVFIFFSFIMGLYLSMRRM